MLRFVKAFGCALGYLIVFDIIGVVVSFVLDVLSGLPLRSLSGALYYAVWFVLGGFGGLLCYSTAGSMLSQQAAETKPGSEDWDARPDAAKTGRLVLITVALTLVVISVPCYLLQWDGLTASSSYVPDSEPLSITFFVAFLGGAVVAHKALPREAKKTM